MGTILIESNRNSVDPNAFLEENYVCNYDLYKIRFITLIIKKEFFTIYLIIYTLTF